MTDALIHLRVPAATKASWVRMTPSDLRAWQSHMGISGREAARRLGVSAGTYQDWVTGTSRTTKKPIALPPMLGLACAALAAGLGEWRPA